MKVSADASCCSKTAPRLTVTARQEPGDGLGTSRQQAVRSFPRDFNNTITILARRQRQIATTGPSASITTACCQRQLPEPPATTKRWPSPSRRQFRRTGGLICEEQGLRLTSGVRPQRVALARTRHWHRSHLRRPLHICAVSIACAPATSNHDGPTPAQSAGAFPAAPTASVHAPGRSRA